MSVFAILSAVPFTFFVSLGIYVMYSNALYRMSDNTGINSSILAWVPFARLFTLGQLADRYNDSVNIKSYYRFILPVLKIAEKVFQLCLLIEVFLLEYIIETYFIFGTLCIITTLAMRVLELICYYKVFSDFEPNCVVPYVILCVFGLEWIAMFLCRNNVPIGIAGHCRPKQPRYIFNRY